MYDSLTDFIPKKIRENRLLYQCIAETMGTMILVIFGVGAVCSAIVANSMQDIVSVAIIWGIGLSLGIYMAGPISGGHFNPAVSFAFALLRPSQFSWLKFLFYSLSQLLGGILGGFVNYLAFYDLIHQFEKTGVEREDKKGKTYNKEFIRKGESGVYSAMIFGEYFPNPTIQLLTASDEGAEVNFKPKLVTAFNAFLVEMWGTAILMFFILVLIDRRQTIVHPRAAPVLIGFTLAALEALYGPLTQGGFNPARDFGPRIVSAMLGWGKNAIPGPRNGFWVYIVGPLVGAPLGGAVFDLLVAPGLQHAKEAEETANHKAAKNISADDPEFRGHV